jgi:hypothetical protein
MELTALTAFLAPFGPHDCREAFPWGAQVTSERSRRARGSGHGKATDVARQETAS